MDSGIGAGDRVALWAPNGAEWMLAALGALSAGAVLVPVSTRFTGPEALDVISRSGAQALFVAGGLPLGGPVGGFCFAGAGPAPPACPGAGPPLPPRGRRGGP